MTASEASPMSTLVDITVPASQEATEALVVGWLKQPGDRVEEHEPLLEISTDKVTMEVAAPASGMLYEILKQNDETIQPGDVLGRIAVGVEAVGVDGEAAPAEVATVAQPTAEAPDTLDRRRRLSPLVKRMLQEHNLDPSQITGTGRGRRITHKDVLAFLERPVDPPVAPLAAPTGPIPSRMIPHTSMRRQIANHMVESLLRTAPHVTAVFDADMTAVVNHRAAHKQAFETKGIKLTYTAYFVKAAAEALQAVPEVNSRWHDDALEVFEDVNIGIATALGKEGLIVPVIHQAHFLDLFGIATRLQTITQKARASQLLLEDVQHGTFTLTNHGVSGSLIATPIINQPQSAILGIGKLEKRLVVVEEKGRDTIQIAPRAYVTLTIDHRALDGFTANTFLSKFVESLEHWA